MIGYGTRECNRGRAKDKRGTEGFGLFLMRPSCDNGLRRIHDRPYIQTDHGQKIIPLFSGTQVNIRRV